MSRKLHREISRRGFRIGAYDEQMVKNRASRSARTAVLWRRHGLFRVSGDMLHPIFSNVTTPCHAFVL